MLTRTQRRIAAAQELWGEGSRPMTTPLSAEQVRAEIEKLPKVFYGSLSTFEKPQFLVSESEVLALLSRLSVSAPEPVIDWLESGLKDLMRDRGEKHPMGPGYTSGWNDAVATVGVVLGTVKYARATPPSGTEREP